MGETREAPATERAPRIVRHVIVGALGKTIVRAAVQRQTERERLREGFEHGIWRSRFLVIIAVIASLTTALGLFIVAAFDTVSLVGEMIGYLRLNSATRDELKYPLLTQVAENIDGFLFATILLMFALGLYELFISRIHVSERGRFASGILVITSIDDLKSRLSQVIFLILVVRYFEFALRAAPTTMIEILEFAGGLVLVASAIFLTSRK